MLYLNSQVLGWENASYFPLRTVNYLDLFKGCLVCGSEMFH